MKVITSRDNIIYKQTAKLLRKKSRDESGLYLLEGKKPLRDALEMGLMIEKIFACQGTDVPEYVPEDKCILLDRKLFSSISDTVVSQGIIAVVRRNRLSAEEFDEAADGSIVVLDRLQDPGNAGTIIRTAEAAGFKGVLAIRGSVDLFSPKVVRSAAGALLRMPVITDVDSEDAIRIVRYGSRRLAATALEGAVSCFEADLKAPVALVIGNEGSGVGREFLEAADLKVRIPMEGSIESLNAAVAAGILMYCVKK